MMNPLQQQKEMRILYILLGSDYKDISKKKKKARQRKIGMVSYHLSEKEMK